LQWHWEQSNFIHFECAKKQTEKTLQNKKSVTENMKHKKINKLIMEGAGQSFSEDS
jgi:hypothetical protein